MRLRLDRVRLAIGGRTLLADASFAIAAGAFVGVIGPNGAGKTTLLRAILGLAPLASGRILVDDAPIGTRAASIGYLPQLREQAPPPVAAIDLLRVAAQTRRWGPPFAGRAVRAEIDRVLDLVDARALAARRIDTLSGGERQRLRLAQALLGGGKAAPRGKGLLLLDEPLAALDPRRQGEIVALVDRVRAETGAAVLFASHEINPLLDRADLLLRVGGGDALLGTVDESLTGPGLSRLYGAPIEVVRAGGRAYVIGAAARPAPGACAGASAPARATG